MKRTLIIIAFLAGIAASLGLIRAVISPEIVASRVTAILSADLMGRMSFSGQPEVDLFPRLAVSFADAALAGSGAGTPRLTAKRLTARLDILSLLTGHLSVTEVELDHPRLEMRAQASLADSTPDRSLLSKLHPAAILVHGGEVMLTAEDGSHVEAIHAIEAELWWPREESSASFVASFVWRGQPVNLAWQGLAPRRLAVGAACNLELTLALPGLNVGFSGLAALSDAFRLDGMLSVDSRGLGALGRNLGLIETAAVGPLAAFARLDPSLSLSGRLQSQGWSAVVNEAHLRIGKAAAEGLVSLAFDTPRPQLRGTLAFDRLTFADSPEPIAADWRAWRIEPKPLTVFDVDLRASVNELTIGGIVLQHPAAALLVQEGRFNAEVSDTGLLGGTGSLTLRGFVGRERATADGRFSLIDVSAPTLLSLFVDDKAGLSRGSLSLLADVKTEGATLGEVVNRLDGHLNLEAAQIATRYPWALPALSSLNPTAVLPDQTPTIEHLSADIDLAGVNATVKRLIADLGSLRLDLSGTVSLADASLWLSGRMAPRDAPTDGTKPADAIGLRITGPLLHPAISPEAAGDVTGASPPSAKAP
ncbi:MAG: hypothetical protein P4L98_03525 [Ancalomicrobiaceae bacterium]|nr:hypothetical protein [Ancalomicrobiaceae bacterium]